MARRSNKITIHVSPRRTDQVVTVKGSGHFGRLQLATALLRDAGLPLSPSTDAKAYWNSVLVTAQAMILSM